MRTAGLKTSSELTGDSLCLECSTGREGVARKEHLGFAVVVVPGQGKRRPYALAACSMLPKSVGWVTDLGHHVVGNTYTDRAKQVVVLQDQKHLPTGSHNRVQVTPLQGTRVGYKEESSTTTRRIQGTVT